MKKKKNPLSILAFLSLIISSVSAANPVTFSMNLQHPIVAISSMEQGYTASNNPLYLLGLKQLAQARADAFCQSKDYGFALDFETKNLSGTFEGTSFEFHLFEGRIYSKRVDKVFEDSERWIYRKRNRETSFAKSIKHYPCFFYGGASATGIACGITLLCLGVTAPIGAISLAAGVIGIAGSSLEYAKTQKNFGKVLSVHQVLDLGDPIVRLDGHRKERATLIPGTNPKFHKIFKQISCQ